MNFCFFILLLFSATVAQDQTNESRVVSTTQGPVRGYKAADGNYFSFYGIPYASVPTGRDKFKAPLPGPTWQEPFEAVDFFVLCRHLLPGESLAYLPDDYPYDIEEGQRDDCLVAHVFVPNTNETNLPVFVNVHGGAYFSGSGVARSLADMVIRGNFIGVSFNYRLGVHGFLCLGTEQVPGNAGMKDMVALLRWVNRNIGSFGGNPDDVTLGGYSAGSSAAELLMLSPLARGLFHKVIPESGNAVAVWSVQQDPLDNAKFFAATLGFTSDDVYELEDYFTSLSIQDMVTLELKQTFKDSTFRTVPCVERRISGVESFLTESPLSIIQRGDYAKVPYLVGFAELEGILILPNFYQWKNEMNYAFSNFMPADLEFRTNQEKEEVATLIKEFYFGTQDVSDVTVLSFIDFYGDVMFAYPALRSVKLMAEGGHNLIYVYEYAFFDENLHGFPVPNSTIIVYGAAHCAQTNELFPNLAKIAVESDDTLSPDHLRVRNTLRDMWINFIKTSFPLPNPTAEFPEGWPAASANRSPHMRFDNSSYLGGFLLEERAAFWDGIYDRYYREPIPPPDHHERNDGCRLFYSVFATLLISSIIFVL